MFPKLATLRFHKGLRINNNYQGVTMIVTIAYDVVAFSAGPFTELQDCALVVDMYVGF